ncbi:MAG: GNAT family N-acetyltransferase [Lachnospiraceae bacterium]|nr:GNAT family N-acetyltransferase [Lachnospiraceae bacterium]
MYYENHDVILKDGSKIAFHSVRADEAATALRCLNKLLAAEGKSTDLSEEDEKRYLEKVLDDEGSALLGVYKDGDLLGFARLKNAKEMYAKDRDCCNIGITLDESIKSEEVCGRAVEALIDVIQRIGYQQIEVDVKDMEEDRIHMYREYGFEKQEDKMVKQFDVKFQYDEKATTDLEEWIEEQGIQLRY